MKAHRRLGVAHQISLAVAPQRLERERRRRRARACRAWRFVDGDGDRDGVAQVTRRGRGGQRRRRAGWRTRGLELWTKRRLGLGLGRGIGAVQRGIGEAGDAGRNAGVEHVLVHHRHRSLTRGGRFVGVRDRCGQTTLGVLEGQLARISTIGERVVERIDDGARDRRERLEHAATRRRHGADRRCAVTVQLALEIFDRGDAADVALVVLHHMRHAGEVTLLLAQVVEQVLETLEVRVHPRDLRIGDEHDAVGPRQHQLARRVVIDLARDGEELQAHAHAPRLRHAQRQEVEVERAIDRGREAHHLAAMLGTSRIVDVLERRRLSSEAGAIEDDLEHQLLPERVYGGHRPGERYLKSSTQGET